jgi:group I intron endonuclease
MNSSVNSYPSNFVYGLIDSRNGQLRYIGATTRGVQRLWEHFTLSRKDPNTHKQNWLKSLAKFGLRPEVEVIEETKLASEVFELERFWIEYYKRLDCKLLNITGGGEGAYGYKHSLASKRKMSESKKGIKRRPRTLEHKQKLSNALRGRKLSDSAKINMRRARLGRKFKPLIDEHRNKISRANGGRSIVDQKSVTYPSVRQAARSLNLDSSAISKVLKGKGSNTKGYVFNYV